MRPPVLPSGNPRVRPPLPGSTRGFNEAAGFTQRKRTGLGSAAPRSRRFNEAAGFTQRKPPSTGIDHCLGVQRASMRPPVLPSGNPQEAVYALNHSISFNEAAGFTQRKPSARPRHR